MTRRGTNSSPHRKEAWLTWGTLSPKPPGFSAILPSHVAIQNQNTNGEKPCLSPATGLAPEVGAQVASLRCLTLRSGHKQSNQESSNRK